VKSLTLAISAAACLLLGQPALAGEALLVVEDPTPGGAFSGSYTESCHGKAPGSDHPSHSQKCSEGYQDGHVAVYEDGLIACNGSTAYAPYDQNGDGSNDPLQGYVWVGPNYEATGDTNFVAPGGVAGVGSNHGKLSHEPTGEPPCPEADPEGDGSGQ
jgi:hypothetical protein